MYTILGQDNERFGISASSDSVALKLFFDLIKHDYNGPLKNEFFEILNDDGSKSGNLKLRDFIHRDGDLHGVFHLHVYTIEDGIPYLLLQKRNESKDICPDKLDTLVAGHYAVGEELKDGLREAREEVGLNVKIEDTTYLGKRYNLDNQPEIINREIQDVSVVRCDWPLEKYKLEKEEVAGIVKVPIAGFINLMNGEQDMLDSKARMYNGDDLRSIDFSFTKADVWPTTDDYYLKAALVIDALVGGRVIDNPFGKDISHLMRQYNGSK